MGSTNYTKKEKQHLKRIEKRAKQAGFSLIELMLVLAISAIAFLGFLNMEKRKAEVQNSENAGGQVVEAGQALSAYMNRESTFLKANIPPGTEVILPMSALTNPTGTTGIYPNHQLLPNTFNNATLLNTTYSLVVKNNPGNILTGLVVTDNPVVDATGAVRYDYIGTAIKRMGPQGGMTFPAANTLAGLGGQWSLSNADFSKINQVGLLGYRVQYQGEFDSTYLRLDGQFPMTGNLNMGNYNITNATDISYNGWLYGNNATLNNLISGTITNSGNIQTKSINGTAGTHDAQVWSAVSASGSPNYANFDNMYTRCINCGLNGEGPSPYSTVAGEEGQVRIGGTGNQGSLLVKDVLLGASATRGNMANAMLSDRLSRYVDRGIVTMLHGQTLAKPAVNAVAVGGAGLSGYACNYIAGTTPPIPKIELVLRSAYVQSRVVGTIGINSADAGGGMTALSINQDQIAIGGFETKALDYGSYWQVEVNTPEYSPYGTGYVGGEVLAHIYCDYGS